MGSVFEKFQQEENKKMLLLGAKVVKLSNSGESIENISKRTGLTIGQVKEIFNELEKQ